MTVKEVIVVLLIVGAFVWLGTFKIWADHDIDAKSVHYKQDSLVACRRAFKPDRWFLMCDNL